MSIHRTKEYLCRYIIQLFDVFEPEKLGLSTDFECTVRSWGTNWIQLSIKDPTERMPRHFEIRITEKL